MTKTRLVLLIGVLSLLMYAIDSYAGSCLDNEDCYDGKICTTDKCINYTDCPGDCPALNCTGCDNETKCVNDAISGCQEDRHIEEGEHFLLGEGNCEARYLFNGKVGDENKIKIDGEEIEYNVTSYNSKGYYIRYKESEHGLWYGLRYNNNTRRLYLEDFPECDIKDDCSSNTDCEDDNPCTYDECDGFPLKCKHRRINWCRDDDDCCPSYNENCNYQNDNDCLDCNEDIDCNDNNQSTLDACDTRTRQCVYLGISVCNNDDGKCGEGCTHYSDNDCPRPVECGDDYCASGENCCRDCGCSEGYECMENVCEKTELTIVKEAIEESNQISLEDGNLIKEGYELLKEDLERKNETVYVLNRIYKKGSTDLNLTVDISNEGEILHIYLNSNQRGILKPLIIIVLITIVVLVGGFFIQKKIKRRRRKQKKQMMFRGQQQGQQRYTPQQQNIYYDQYGNPIGPRQESGQEEYFDYEQYFNK